MLTDDRATESSDGSVAATLAQVRQNTAQLLSEIDTPLRSLHVQVGDVAIDIEWSESRRNGTATHVTTTELQSLQPEAPAAEGPQRSLLTAQAVGVFYRCPEPGADPFVREGDVVTPGQQVGIIEAMKLMIPVEAEVGGRIVEVLTGDGEPVEYGEPLFALAPADSGQPGEL